jgi:hypothetical protein
MPLYIKFLKRYVHTVSEAVDTQKYIISVVRGENVEANFNIHYKW